MDSVLIPCPKCGKDLKLRDRKLLGKQGRCPKCKHRFVLEEPDEVQLELAESDAPPVGTSAQWVPDEGHAAQSVVAMAPAQTSPIIRTEQPAAIGKARIQAARQRRRKQLRLGAIVGAISAMIIGAILLWANSGGTTANTAKKKNGSPDIATNRDPEPLGGGVDEPRSSLPPAPTKGKPIRLNFIPTGARMIIHLRPAELWKLNSPAETVRLCLGGPLNVWTEKKLKELLLFEPNEIEQAVICLFLDDKNKPPEIACSVKLLVEQKPSTFIEKFGGKPDTELGRKIYKTVGSDTKPATAYMITDQVGKGFASVPAYMAADMVSTVNSPGLPGGGLEELLKRTDSSRHLTILFDPADLSGHRKYLFPESVYPVLGHFLDRFETTAIESVAWSFYFGGKEHTDFHSEMILRNRTDGNPQSLKNDMARKLADLPKQLAGVIRQMTPRMMAERKLVSRLPVMIEAFRIETVYTKGSENERFVKLTTALPVIAGPNLAAAGMLTWRLASVTDFSKKKPKPTGRKLPALVVDRLKLPVEIDFRQRPLKEAMNDIADAIGVKSELDGKALMDASITQNEKQTMKLGTVTAKKAISEIFKKYPRLVLVIDEATKTIITTTKKFAEMNGQKIFPLKPPKNK